MMDAPEYMTPLHIDQRVERIRRLAGDDEAAHGAEDKLWHDVLRAIADGKCERPDVCAERALQTMDIDFMRWCA